MTGGVVNLFKNLYHLYLNLKLQLNMTPMGLFLRPSIKNDL
jgi:hypothetical protein